MVTRIRQLLDWQQLSPTQFADHIGVGRPVMSHILSERNEPSLKVFQRIVEAFPAVSMAWLLSGAGEMLAATNSPPTAAPPSATPSLTTIPPVTPRVAAASSLTAPGPAASAATSPLAPAARRAKTPVVPAPARFVQPGAGRVVASAVPPAAALSPAVVAEPTASPQLPAEPAPSLGGSSAAPALPQEAVLESERPTAASWLAPLAEPGKAIRRIVIFYRDGSFADYQPEG